ncbi:hypothetical protein L1049_019722 [Liquidambar formosana]|uniref:Uncharacterized protein n=1 Tax=Liquidambar formosana TaxID=63359 RepID=A0AAP0X6R0_LIQFO
MVSTMIEPELCIRWSLQCVGSKPNKMVTMEAKLGVVVVQCTKSRSEGFREKEKGESFRKRSTSGDVIVFGQEKVKALGRGRKASTFEARLLVSVKLCLSELCAGNFSLLSGYLHQGKKDESQALTYPSHTKRDSSFLEKNDEARKRLHEVFAQLDNAKESENNDGCCDQSLFKEADGKPRAVRLLVQCLHLDGEEFNLKVPNSR